MPYLKEDLSYFDQPDQTSKNYDRRRKEIQKALNEAVWNTILETNRAISNTPVDQKFAYLGAPENLQGTGAGGAEEPAISPIDFIPWTEMASLGAKGVKAAMKAAPELIGNEIGAVGLDLKSLKGIENLTTKPRIDAAVQALQDIAETNGLSTYEGAFNKFKNKSFDMTDLLSHIETMSPKELEKALEESYSGGIQQFLDDYRNKYAKDLYVDYLRSFHAAKSPKVKESLKDSMKSITSEGIHIK